MKIIEFDHHGKKVKARDDLIGKHREYCLCHSCKKLNMEDRDTNCKIANLLYRIDLMCEITTPVFYCAKYEEKQ